MIGEVVRTIDVPNGSLVWKMGKLWGILSPSDDGTYSNKNIRYSSCVPKGVTRIPTGRGSVKHSLQVIGTLTSTIDVDDIDMGWTHAHVFTKDGQLHMEFNGGHEAITKRWAMGIMPTRKYNKRVPTVRYEQPSEIELDVTDITNLSAISHERKARNQAQWEWLRSEVYIRDKGICWVCNEFVLLRDYDLGHLVDRANGGHDAIDNCTVMHHLCNLLKPRHNSLDEASIWKLRYKPLASFS